MFACRTFLGLEVSTGHSQLTQLTKVIDKTMEEFCLSTFYKVCFLTRYGYCMAVFQLAFDEIRLTSFQLEGCSAENLVLSFIVMVSNLTWPF